MKRLFLAIIAIIIINFAVYMLLFVAGILPLQQLGELRQSIMVVLQTILAIILLMYICTEVLGRPTQHRTIKYLDQRLADGRISIEEYQQIKSLLKREV